MDNPASVASWIALLQTGDERAAQCLWDEFYRPLMRVAGAKLKGHQRCLADEEDVVLAALDSFFRAARRGRFADLRSRDGLERLLAEMTRRKAVDLIRFNVRRKRSLDGGLAADLLCSGSVVSASHAAADRFGGGRDLLETLHPELQHVALLKLQGYTNREIARQLACSLATVERRCRLIRELWRKILEW